MEQTVSPFIIKSGKLARLRNRLRRPTVLALLAFTIALAIWFSRSPQIDPVFKTVAIEKGDLVVTIDATGTVEPVEVIDVGAQVAGLISSFGVDKAGKTIDYGSEVEAGTVLAQIDDSLYQAEVRRAQAELQVAKAQVAQARAKLSQAERDWDRAQKLGSGNALAKTSYDAYEAAFRMAQAEIGVSEGAVAQADAALFKAQKNLGYTTIQAPVRGVIIDRRVNIGQTVVSSLNAPSLFLIAKDLRQMQVWVSVNEADIGNIFPGQSVDFTVDARPGQSFTGSVGKIRLNASMNQNVVTYIVEVNTDNSDGRLLPYLTANVRFKVKDLHDVLLVPNSATRWSPGKFGGVGQSDRPSRDARPSSSNRPPTRNDKNSPMLRAKIWVDQDGVAEPIDVDLLGTDGRVTAIDTDELKVDDLVIIGRADSEDAASGSRGNPFVPQMPRRGRRGGH